MRRKDTFYVVVDLPPGADGKRRQKWYSGYPNKKQAQLALAELVVEIGSGAYVPPSRTMLERCLREHWQPASATRVRPNTLHGYRQVLESYVIPTLGGRALEDLTPGFEVDTPHLRVPQQLVVVDGRPALTVPKTSASRRLVALDEHTAPALEAHRRAQRGERFALGPSYQDHDLVMCRTDGSPVNPTDRVAGFFRRSRELDCPAALPRSETHARDLGATGRHPCRDRQRAAGAYEHGIDTGRPQQCPAQPPDQTPRHNAVAGVRESNDGGVVPCRVRRQMGTLEGLVVRVLVSRVVSLLAVG